MCVPGTGIPILSFTPQWLLVLVVILSRFPCLKQQFGQLLNKVIKLSAECPHYLRCVSQYGDQPRGFCDLP